MVVVIKTFKNLSKIDNIRLITERRQPQNYIEYFQFRIWSIFFVFTRALFDISDRIFKHSFLLKFNNECISYHSQTWKEISIKLQRTKRNFVHYDDGTLKFMIIDNYFDNVPENMTKCRFQLYGIGKNTLFAFASLPKPFN